MPDHKPTLFEIWKNDATHFDVDQLCDEHEVSVISIKAMLRNKPVWKLQAESVLKALSKMTGKDYSLETVHVKLMEETGDGSRKQQ
jgi:hypothetical protein